MVMTLTLSADASARMDGNSLPADQSPAAMRARICSMIWRYIGRASVWEMFMPLYILCIQCILSCKRMGRGGKPFRKKNISRPNYRAGGAPRSEKKNPAGRERTEGLWLDRTPAGESSRGRGAEDNLLSRRPQACFAVRQPSA